MKPTAIEQTCCRKEGQMSSEDEEGFKPSSGYKHPTAHAKQSKSSSFSLANIF